MTVFAIPLQVSDHRDGSSFMEVGHGCRTSSDHLPLMPAGGKSPTSPSATSGRVRPPTLEEAYLWQNSLWQNSSAESNELEVLRRAHNGSTSTPNMSKLPQTVSFLNEHASRATAAPQMASTAGALQGSSDAARAARAMHAVAYQRPANGVVYAEPQRAARGSSAPGTGQQSDSAGNPRAGPDDAGGMRGEEQPVGNGHVRMGSWPSSKLDGGSGANALLGNGAVYTSSTNYTDTH